MHMLGTLGFLIAGVSAGTFWYLLPKNGQTHPIVTMPFLDQLVPVSLVSGLAIGITMFISAFTS
jgi:hypothetical protein